MSFHCAIDHKLLGTMWHSELPSAMKHHHLSNNLVAPSPTQLMTLSKGPPTIGLHIKIGYTFWRR